MNETTETFINSITDDCLLNFVVISSSVEFIDWRIKSERERERESERLVQHYSQADTARRPTYL
jgi:hypothetical protein